GSHAYLQEGWAMPYFSVIEGEVGSTQFLYRHGEEDYLGSPFNTSTIDRDGPLDAGGVNQLVFFFARRLVLTLAYSFEREHPYRSSGDDFDRQTNQGLVGVQIPAWWRTFFEIDYLYRSDDYTKRQSVTDFRTKRHDDGSYIAAFVRRPIIQHLDALLSYYG